MIYLPQQRRSKWLPSIELEESQPRSLDDINTYLDDPVVSRDSVREAGGLIKYWHQAATLRPRVSKMGSDFCSAPGKFL